MDNRFLLVAGDVHNNEDSLEYLVDIANSPGCTAFLYTGDINVENYFIGTALRNRNFVFLPVLGNCDYPYSFISSDVPVPPVYRTCVYFGKRIFITHGHLYTEPDSAGLDSRNFDIVIIGHTHVPSKTERNGIVFINPGSASIPRGGSEKSYIRISPDGNIVFGTIKKTCK